MLGILWLACGLAVTGLADNERLAELRKQFETFIRDTQRQEQEGVKQLGQRYLAGLTALEDALQSAGNQLTVVLAVHAEKVRFEQTGDLPDSALVEQPLALRKLQDGWRVQTAGLPRAQAQKIVMATEQYLQGLTALQKELATRNDKGGVAEIKAEKDRVLGNNRVREALSMVQSMPPPPGGRSGAGTGAGLPKFDVVKEFSIKENPGRVWSYGWVKRPGDVFHLYTKKSGDKAYPAIRRWGSAENPGICINTGEETLRPCGTMSVRPRQVWLHPGPSGDCSAIRWTAPRSGTVTITGAFIGMSDGGSTTTTDVHVYHNKKEIFGSSVNLQGHGNESPFEVKVKAQIGDAVYFVVGYGNGTFYCDSTGLEAVIEYVP